MESLVQGAIPGATDVLGWFGAKIEFAKAGHRLIRNLYENRSGLSRFDRTQRIEAAHAILVIIAYFEALENGQPLFEELQISRSEQVSLSAGGSASATHASGLVSALVSADIPRPSAELSREQLKQELLAFYANITDSLARFIQGLAAWEGLSAGAQAGFMNELRSVPLLAHKRYERLLAQLAEDFPEVAAWARLQDARSERSQVESKHAELRAALAGLEASICALSANGPRDELREGLGRAYRAALGRPIIETGDTPSGLRIPSLERAYISPAFKAASVTAADNPSDEQWWAAKEIRSDLEQFLLAYVTSGQATNAPLLILGQPGSGKSVLTRIISARLIAGDFLPVRVVLRDMPTVSDLQDSIETAMRNITGYRLNWVQVAGSSGGALPVVMLDGFDELLQATGVSQSDYLIRVANFQQREAEQGRPLVVMVTSRLSVADRARAPEGTVAIRLQAFDDVRINVWIERWNLENQSYFTEAVRPLDSAIVMAHKDLAEQPLLLLMLALYDAEGNQLHVAEGQLRQKDLYSRLLQRFAEREVRKRHVGLDTNSVRSAVEEELRRLGVVAFAMFNRLGQWVSDDDLQSDLAAIFGVSPEPTSTTLRQALRTADLALGSFFFIHKAEAASHDQALQTYEFLHATFGEFLVAYLTWELLQDVAARSTKSGFTFGVEQVHDDKLYDFMSFAVLSVRAPALKFLAEMVSDSANELRAVLGDALLRLFWRANYPRPGHSGRSYQPRPLGLPARCAAYSANLLLLIVCCRRNLRASLLFSHLKSDIVSTWNYQTVFWRSQLTNEEWSSLVEVLTVDRLWLDQMPDIGLSFGGGNEPLPNIDPYWVYGDMIEPSERGKLAFGGTPRLEVMRRKSRFQCNLHEDVIYHSVDPIVHTIGSTLTTFAGWWPDDCPSAAHALLDVWTCQFRGLAVEEVERRFLMGARIGANEYPVIEPEVRERYLTLMLQSLAVSSQVGVKCATDIISLIASSVSGADGCSIGEALIKCCISYLGREREADGKLGVLLGTVLVRFGSTSSEQTVAEAIIRLMDCRLQVPWSSWIGDPSLGSRLRDAVVRHRPDLSPSLG